jgi:hypothetical protein
MTNKEENLKTIINDISGLNPILDETRKQQITNFIISAVNGDIPTSHLIINANLGENNRGIIIYILTDLRLIKIDIDAKEIKSGSFPLNTLIGIERKLIDGDIAQFSIAFQNGTFGLRYSQDDQKITDFFQKIDQARAAK